MFNVLLLIDTRNISFCLSKTFPDRSVKLDYKKYIEAAVGQDILYRAVAFGTNSTEQNYKFTGVLKNLGMDVKFSNPIPGKDVTEKPKYIRSNVAMALTAMQLIETNKIDKVIVGSSDYELIELVTAIKSKGIICEIYACGIPKILRENSNKYTEIGEQLLFAPQAIDAK